MDSEPSKTQPQKRTLKNRQKFLKAFANNASVRWAASAAGIAPKTHYRWMLTDSAYAVAAREAKRAAGDFTYLEPVYCPDSKWSGDGRLMRLLCRLKPGVYGRKASAL